MQTQSKSIELIQRKWFDRIGKLENFQPQEQEKEILQIINEIEKIFKKMTPLLTKIEQDLNKQMCPVVAWKNLIEILKELTFLRSFKTIYEIAFKFHK